MVTYFMNAVQGNAVRPDGAPADTYTPYESQTGGQVIMKTKCQDVSFKYEKLKC
jgi:hypothetical protein